MKQACMDPNCHYDPATDSKKFVAVKIGGKLRVKLRRIALTLLVCPKCGLTYVTKGFKSEVAAQKIREKRQRKRLEKLKELYHPVSFIKDFEREKHG